MPLPQTVRAPDHGPTDDPDFWLRDLRLGRYAELRRHIDDASYRAQRIASWFRQRRHLLYVAERLDLPTDGTIADLQARLVHAGARVLPYLAVGAYLSRKLPTAVEDTATSVLDDEDLAACRDAHGQYDRLLLLLRVLDVHPEALAHVRALQLWHRHGAAELTLRQAPAIRRTGLAEFLTRENVARAVAPVPLPAGVPGVSYEMVVRRPGGDALLVLRRNYRRTHHWSDDGERIAHGHDEELMLLHFLDDGRQLRISAKTGDLPRRLAEAVATAWFGGTCVYEDDLVPAEPASLSRMVAALLSRQVQGVRLVELAVRDAPLDGSPELVLRTSSAEGDISDAIAHFERQVGPLLDRLADVVHIKVVFRGRRVEINFPVVGGRPVARFADGRLDRHAAEAFRDFVQHEFGLPLHSMETRCP